MAIFTEKHLQIVWGLRLFRQAGLLTEDARALVVDFPGLPSVEGGPDFRGARLRIGGRETAGDVELHLTTDGWRAHGHGAQGAYDGVVLHVALERGRSPGPGGVAELVLAPYLDRSLADLSRELEPGAPAAPGPGDLDALGDARFERRVERLRRIREPVAQVFWREVLIALGYKENKAPFEELARLAPLAALRGADDLEGRLRESAARLRWRLRGVRPGNRPDRRIGGAARWLAAVGTDAPHVPHFERPAEATFDPDGTGQIGPERAAAIRANVVLPLAAAAGTPDQARRARTAFRDGAPGAPHRKIRDAVALFGTGAPTTLRREWGLMEALSRFLLAPARGAC